MQPMTECGGSGDEHARADPPRMDRMARGHQGPRSGPDDRALRAGRHLGGVRRVERGHPVPIAALGGLVPFDPYVVDLLGRVRHRNLRIQSSAASSETELYSPLQLTTEATMDHVLQQSKS